MAAPTKSKKSCGPVRPSRRTRWRAASLILVHLAVAAHIVHWKSTGRTITPVEPSEAMQTLGQGLVNAGFLFFFLLILSTLVLGRFFCGWACHIVALQDLCTGVLRKLGIRPRPFRSRLLVFVPILAAIWMFVVPSVVRALSGAPTPDAALHLTTDDFWGRFPGPIVAGLTFLVCGFVIVYVLGNKGFCTYGCPYGGIFGLADKIAPGKIRVTDACEGCGHCTVTCTSNVRVHEEVRVYGMVVDPGCMKCMDCITVCPKEALYYGIGAPSVAKGKARAPIRPRRYDYTWREEIAMAAIFLVSIVILRALYDAVPFLLALGLAAISTHSIMTAVRMRREKSLKWGPHVLKSGGRTTTAARVFGAGAALWIAFLVHSAIVQYHALGGQRSIAKGHLVKGREMLVRASAIGLFPSAYLEARIAQASEALGEGEAARRRYERAAEISPDFTHARYALARHALAAGDRVAAAPHLAEVVRVDPGFEDATEKLVELLVEEGRDAEAASMLDVAVRRRPHDARFRRARALVLARLSRPAEAIDEARRALDLAPDDAAGPFTLGRILASTDRNEEALAALERAVRMDPRNAEAHYILARVATRLGHENVIVHLDRARRAAPLVETYVRAWALLMARAGTVDRAIEAMGSGDPSDRETLFQLMHLHRAAGREEEAARIASRLARAAPVP